MRTLTIVAAWILIAAIAAPVTAAELRIRVTDAEGKAIDHAKVTWIYAPDPFIAGPGNLSTWTTAAGYASFDRVHPGVHRVVVRKAGYLPTVLSSVPIQPDLRQSIVALSVILNVRPSGSSSRSE